MKQWKRILAILAVVLILGLYLVTLVCAIFVKRLSNQMFLFSIVATVLVPLVLYLLFWLYDLLQSRKDTAGEWEVRTRKGFAAAAAFQQGKKLTDGTESHSHRNTVAEEADQEDDELEMAYDEPEPEEEEMGLIYGELETEEDEMGLEDEEPEEEELELAGEDPELGEQGARMR